MNRQRYKIIACAVFARECYHCAAISGNIIDIRLLDQGLHDMGEAKMSAALQREIDAVDTETYDAILLVYGLCNHGIRNLHAGIPLVVPRAHDCITLLMGSKEAYLKYFHEYPGCFFRSVGWAERAHHNLDNPDSTTRQLGMGSYEEYVELYGEDNARYLMETLGDHLRNYSRLSYIDTGLPLGEDYPREARALAEDRAWEYLEVKGSTRLIQNLMDGRWDAVDYLVVEPGKTIQASYDETIIKAEPKGRP
jgi:hypothetical protein